jgi:hypothetical protein
MPTLKAVGIDAWFFFGTLGVLLWLYRRFIPDLCRFLIDHGVQAVILILFFALIYGQIGQGLGLPLLFWSEEPLTRWFVAVCSTLLLAVIGINGYYLLGDIPIPRGDGPFPRMVRWVLGSRAMRWVLDSRVMRWVLKFLAGGGEQPLPGDGPFLRVMRAVFDFLDEPYDKTASPLRSPTESQSENRFFTRARRRLRRTPGAVIFLDHTWLDPRPPAAGGEFSNPYLLSRFLRLVRLPFLVLLALPALLPRFFVNLPRFAPVIQNIQERRYYGENNRLLSLFSLSFVGEPDVVNSSGAYWYAVAVWLIGIWCGVMMVKVFLFLSDRVSSGERHRLRSVSVYFVFAAITFLAMARTPIYDGEWIRKHLPVLTDYQGIAPGAAILILLGLAALIAALVALIFEGWSRCRPLAVAAAVAFVAWQNSAPDSYRFENLDYSASAPLKTSIGARYPNDVAPGKPADAAKFWPLVPDIDALKAWKARCQGSDGSSGGLPKLVVVCTSGGAIRAAYWTATVLDRLEAEVGRKGPSDEGDFHKHVRVITGASGGMVGASYYVTWLRNLLGDPPAPGAKALPGRDWERGIPIFSLGPVARSIALWDPLSTTFRRFENHLGFYSDRGRVLEGDWLALRYPASDLRERERQGEIPSLIFSPMTVEDGRRLLISNLDLTTLYEPSRPPKDADPPPPLSSVRRLPANSGSVIPSREGPSSLDRVSISGIEFFKIFPTAENNILLATAARMNASFPYVSPAVDLPSDPPLRVVDAGYYDNYGVDVAAAWIFANRFWIEANTSGVLVVQIRDGLSEVDRVSYPAADDGLYARLLRGLQFFFSPIDGVFRARYSSSSFRNDALIAALSDYFSQRTRKREFFTTAILELSSRTIQPGRGPIWEWPGDGLDQKIKYADSSQATEVAMSWYLTVAERQSMDMAIPYEKRPKGFDGVAGGGTKAGELANVLDLSMENAPAPEIEPIDPTDSGQRKKRIEALRELASFIRKQKINDLLHERALYVIEKEFARARNYECLREIDEWWGSK